MAFCLHFLNLFFVSPGYQRKWPLRTFAELTARQRYMDVLAEAADPAGAVLEDALSALKNVKRPLAVHPAGARFSRHKI